jgi:type IV secretion system protein VirB9
LPALYEIRDGAPNLVNFQVEHGVYIVPKVLERGYLAIGKQRLMFESKR